MDNTTKNRRKEERFKVGGSAVLRRGAQRYTATVLNVSSGGLFLKLDTPQTFKIGDEVVCEIKLPEHSDQAFAAWGMARVVRVDSTGTAIELQTGTFD